MVLRGDITILLTNNTHGGDEEFRRFVRKCLGENWPTGQVFGWITKRRPPQNAAATKARGLELACAKKRRD